MQLSLEQLVVSVLGGGATISIAALGFFLKSTFADIKKELSQLNANVQALIVQGSNSSLRHDRTEEEIATMRKRHHDLSDYIQAARNEIHMLKARVDACKHCSNRD